MNEISHVPAPIEEVLPEYPIPCEWILEGRPDSRGRILVESADGKLRSGRWKCTPGKFRWEYDVDEIVWIIDGEVEVTVLGGRTLLLRSGDTVYVPAGTVAVWNVLRPTHKIFFLHSD